MAVVDMEDLLAAMVQVVVVVVVTLAIDSCMRDTACHP